MTGKLIIISAPSGAGKTSILRWLLTAHPELNLHFSISCTTRPPRHNETHGVDYFFISPEQFREYIQQRAFIEYEEVYAGTFYGTLLSQVDSQLARGENIAFDVDVKGGCNIKTLYRERALAIFIAPPSRDELERRLRARATNSEEDIQKRLTKADKEMTFAPRFDHIVVNDALPRAQEEVLQLINKFLSTP